MLVLISMILMVLLVAAGMIVFMKRMIDHSVVGQTSHLDRLSDELTQKEEAIKKEFEETRLKCQELLANAQKDAALQKDLLLKQAKEEQERLAAEAHQGAAEIIKQAENARLALIAEMEQKINDRALGKAAELLRSAIPEEIKSGIHAKWTESVISGSLENLDRLKVPGGLSEVSVVTAFPLEQAQRKALTQKLKDKLGFEVKLAEKVDPSLIAGVSVTVGSLCLDGSLAFKIQEVARGQR